MVTCSVKDCGVNHRNNPENYTFHRFPLDPIVRGKWLRLIGRVGWNPKKNSTICSKHFPDVYKRKRRINTVLAKGAIPTLDVPGLLKDRLPSSYVNRDIIIPSTSQEQEISVPLTPRKKKLMAKNVKLKQKLQEKQKKIRSLVAKTKRQASKIVTLQEVLKEIHSRPGLQDHYSDITMTCSNELLQNLINRFNDKKCGKIQSSSKYNEELRKFAITIHFYSPRAYNYLRQKFDLCLPHVNTLRTWYARLDCEPGFTQESFNTIKEMKKKNPDLKVCLTFDEMSIREHTEWVGQTHYGYVNFGNDLAMDGAEIANQVLVFMVVALNSFWKIPVGYFPGRGFTASQKANLLKICLDLLYLTECEVISITFDGIASNLNMAQLLGANFSSKSNLKSHFIYKGRKYLLFLDACHLIKLIRNFFGEKRILFDTEFNKIDFGYIEALHQLQTEIGLHLANKLTFRHINYVKQKMKVKLASQLLSRSVATAIEYSDQILKLTKFQNSKATVTFIIHVNDIFDIFNSRNFLNYGYKKPLCKQNKNNIFNKLDEVYDYFCNLKFEDGSMIIHSLRKLGLLGFLINITSLKSLYVDFIEKGTLKFIPFYKLSQDHLETFFSAIRSRGGFNNNPTLRNFKSAYKRLLCHTEIKSSESGNCLALEDITILSNSKLATDQQINTSLTYNKITKEFFLSDKTERENDFDHLYFSNNEVPLSNTIQCVVEYIAGFVVKKIKIKIACEECCSAIQSSRQFSSPVSFINKRDFSSKSEGYLTYPSRDVIILCLKIENFIRVNNKITKGIGKSTICKAVLLILEDSSDLFLSLGSHNLDQDVFSGHRYLIMKYVIEIYFDIRLKYECKLNNLNKETVRNHLNKIVLFKSQ